MLRLNYFCTYLWFIGSSLAIPNNFTHLILSTPLSCRHNLRSHLVLLTLLDPKHSRDLHFHLPSILHRRPITGALNPRKLPEPLYLRNPPMIFQLSRPHTSTSSSLPSFPFSSSFSFSTLHPHTYPHGFPNPANYAPPRSKSRYTRLSCLQPKIQNTA